MNDTNIKEFRKHLRVIEREVVRQMKDESCYCNVSPAQCHILLDLEEYGESTLSDVSNRLGLDRSTVSRTVDALVNEGLVDRIQDSNDRRYCSLTLSEKGFEKSSNINIFSNNVYKELFDKIHEEKYTSLLDTMRLITDMIESFRTESNGGCCGNRK